MKASFYLAAAALLLSLASRAGAEGTVVSTAALPGMTAGVSSSSASITPAPAPAASVSDWTVYDSPTFGMRLKYKSGWELKRTDNPADAGSSLLLRVENTPEVLASVTIDRPDYRVADFNAVTSAISLGNLFEGDYQKNNARLGGVEAVKVEGVDRSSDEGRLMVYFVKKDRGLYQFIFSVKPADRWTDYAPLFQTILDSVEFLK